MLSQDENTKLRHAVYWLLIISSVGVMVGRILTVSADHGRTPFLSANDRSRWCTIRSLVDHGTYVIDAVVLKPGSDEFDRDWHSIDMARHRGHDGEEHFYSSKPTLLPTLLAAKYWLIKHTFGATLDRNPFYVGRAILIVCNVLPLVLFFVLLCRLVERYGQVVWGRIFIVTCATWGTFLTTFAVTLNNHLPAAVSSLIAIYATLAIWNDDERRWRYFAIAGLFSAFTAANELPALSFFAVITVAVLYKAPKPALVAFVPAAAIVAFGFFYTNHLAHESWRPAYAHRKDGELLLALPYEKAQLRSGKVSEELRERINASSKEIDAGLSPRATISDAPIIKEYWKGSLVKQRCVLWDPEGHDRFALLLVGDEIPQLQVHAWDNWYEYETSYWRRENKSGVDVGESSRLAYAFHVLIGHHGILSLTPIWLFSIFGVALLLCQYNCCGDHGKALNSQIEKIMAFIGLRVSTERPRYQLCAFAVMVVVLTCVCLAFYTARPVHDRNYGGMSCGLRWMFWFTPMWLLVMLPAADVIADNRCWRIVTGSLLFVSVSSASYATLNPWVHPWIYTYLQYLNH